MENSEKFIDCYNEIDAFLKADGGYVYYESFTQKVIKSKNKTVQKFKDELIAFGELRNAIVHSPRFDGKPIAEPHDDIVARIEEIYKKLTDPEKVYPAFKMKVVGAYKEDYINGILIEMKNRMISQFPVFDKHGYVVELISTNTISHWLAGKLKENGSITVKDVRVGDLILEIEHRNNYKFISKEASIYDAFDLFMEHIEKKKRNLDAIFITESGKGTEKPIGMITIKDIAGKV